MAADWHFCKVGVFNQYRKPQQIGLPCLSNPMAEKKKPKTEAKEVSAAELPILGRLCKTLTNSS